MTIIWKEMEHCLLLIVIIDEHSTLQYNCDEMNIYINIDLWYVQFKIAIADV